MLVIIDYGTGNTGSILNMIRKVGGEATVSSDINEIMEANALILPGVGAFDNAMNKLNHSGLLSVIEQRVLVDKVPFLGVCLGMQLLFDGSEEGVEKGLGWISGKVRKFDSKIMKHHKLKVPHMGWNIIKPATKHKLYAGLEGEARFYFVHTYHVVCEPKYVIAETDYGYPFVCSVQKDNIFGAQFHPEKSHRFGMTMFKNFLEKIC